MICNINLRIDILLYIYVLHIETIFGNSDGLVVEWEVCHIQSYLAK